MTARLEVLRSPFDGMRRSPALAAASEHGPAVPARPQGADRRQRAGKVAVVIGATSGIGARTATLLAEEGAKVVIAGRRLAEGEALAQQLGQTAMFVRCDVLVEAHVGHLIPAEADRRAHDLGPLFTSALESWQPLRRAGTPEDVAPGAVWLASDGARFVNGHDLVVDGGICAGRPISVSLAERAQMVPILLAAGQRQQAA